MPQKTSAPGSAEPQLRNACLRFWSVKAELGLRGPRRERPVFLKIGYYSFSEVSGRAVPAPHFLLRALSSGEFHLSEKHKWSPQLCYSADSIMCQTGYLPTDTNPIWSTIA